MPGMWQKNASSSSLWNGPPAKPPYKRWKKALGDIVNWNRFDPAHFMTDAQIEDWIENKRHHIMYKDAKNID